jgi:hypothetical protein
VDEKDIAEHLQVFVCWLHSVFSVFQD